MEAAAPETMEERKDTRIEGGAGGMREVNELLAYSNSNVIILWCLHITGRKQLKINKA